MSSYELLESAILSRLQGCTVPGVVLQLMADNDAASNVKAISPTYRICYIGSEYDKTLQADLPGMFEADAVVQEEFAEIHILVLCKTRRGAKGTYQMIEEAKRLLLGFRPYQWGKMFIKKSETQDGFTDGVFTHDMIFVCKRPVSQQLNDYYQGSVLLENVEPNINPV